LQSEDHQPKPVIFLHSERASNVPKLLTLGRRRRTTEQPFKV